jgi:type I restriction enzyme S subunit
MARGKKNNELTPEERLQQALVPEEEWPYQLPEGWKWVYLGGIADEVTDKTDIFNDQTVKYIGLENIASNNGINGWQSTVGIKSTKTVFNTGDILYGKLRPYLNKHDVTTFSGVCSTDILVLRSSELADARFINYYLNTDSFIEYAVFNSKGINLPRVSPSAVTKACIPLSNLMVQRRIISFLNQEFSHLDEAKDRIQSILDSSEKRKQSILHQAFVGKLTEKWRSLHQIELSQWKYMPLKEACNGLKYGTASKSQKEGEVAVIRMGNLQDGEIDWSNLVYSNNAEDNEKYCLHSGDVLFNRTNSPEQVGKTAIYRGEQPAIYAGYLIKLDYKDFIDGEYLNCIMNSPEEKQYCNQVKSDGVNQSNVSAAKIGEFNIPVPTIGEQHEIVRIFNAYIDNSRAIEDAARTALDQLEKTRKAILSKAFHGELIR